MRNTHDDFCSYEAEAELDECFIAMEDHFTDCEEQFMDFEDDPDINDWFDAVEDELEEAGCFDDF